MEIVAERKWFSLKEAARLVGLRADVLRSAVMDGSLKAYKKPTTCRESERAYLLVNMDDVDAWLRSQTPGREVLACRSSAKSGRDSSRR